MKTFTVLGLQEILKLHRKWLNNEEGGVSANLSGASLMYADLRNVNLMYANLSGANLSDANLMYANLSGANLSNTFLSGTNLLAANLSGANLRWASLSWANLSDADLSEVNLRDADLWAANLSGANLSGANLSGANLYKTNLSDILHKTIYQFSYNKHTAVSIDNHIHIGCKAFTIKHWLKHGHKIGLDNGYTEEEINQYMNWTKSIAMVKGVRAIEMKNN